MLRPHGRFLLVKAFGHGSSILPGSGD
jgi:hypothetical protein